MTMDMPPGVEFEMEREMLDVTSRGRRMVPDPEWEHTCHCGIRRTWENYEEDTLAVRVMLVHGNGDLDDYDVEMRRRCRHCLAIVEPGMIPDPAYRPGYKEFAPGQRSCRITLTIPPFVWKSRRHPKPGTVHRLSTLGLDKIPIGDDTYVEIPGSRAVVVVDVVDSLALYRPGAVDDRTKSRVVELELL